MTSNVAACSSNISIKNTIRTHQTSHLVVDDVLVANPSNLDAVEDEIWNLHNDGWSPRPLDLLLVCGDEPHQEKRFGRPRDR